MGRAAVVRLGFNPVQGRRRFETIDRDLIEEGQKAVVIAGESVECLNFLLDDESGTLWRDISLRHRLVSVDKVDFIRWLCCQTIEHVSSSTRYTACYTRASFFSGVVPQPFLNVTQLE